MLELQKILGKMGELGKMECFYSEASYCSHIYFLNMISPLILVVQLCGCILFEAITTHINNYN